MHPLTLGSTGQFRALRQLLFDHDYTEEAVCHRLQIPSIYDFKTLREGREGDPGINDGLDALIRLLMDEEALPAEALEDRLGPAALSVLEDLAIVKRLSDDQSRVYADAVLYPQEGLFIASDRTFRVDPRADVTLPEDIVYASITKNTGRFVSILPSDPCDSFLELCSGT
ncbi:MAG: putative methyltransferase, partial [Bryobacterales bacterium]|nr:putative methyltransferase [Bryobacterales bacterium]